MSGPRYVITERGEVVHATCGACGAVVEQLAGEEEGPRKDRAWAEVREVMEEHLRACPGRRGP